MGTALIIFGEKHFLLVSENEFTHEIKCNGTTSFMEFMKMVCNFSTLFSTKCFIFTKIEWKRMKMNENENEWEGESNETYDERNEHEPVKNMNYDQ